MNYKTPGVYIEEISTLPASVAPVATAVPAFIGVTKKAEKDGESIANVPTRITSFLDFIEYFGTPEDPAEKATIDFSIEDVTDSGTLLSRVFKASLNTAPQHNLYYSMQLYFNNGGGPCYIVSVGDLTGVSIGTIAPQAGMLGGLKALEKVDEPTLIVFPDAVFLSDVNQYGSLVQQAFAQCETLKDRFVIMDVYGNPEPEDVGPFRTAIGNDSLKYGAAYHPFLKTSLNYLFREDQAVLQTVDGIPAGAFNGLLLSAIKASDPSIYRSLVSKASEVYYSGPPSAAIAGIYARVDGDRGVWKAPANVGVSSVIEPLIRITHEDQQNLNVDATTGKSINAIRTFAGKGTLVWGARTLAGNDNEWRYVPVRRLYIFIEESVKKATDFVVFEPNDKNTWVRVKAMIENFLTGLWREGALAGASPDEAFFVKVGLGETMTSVDILEGRMNVEIGLAAVRPAEFIILKFSHKLQES